ncbi:MAG: hypothetical protein DMG57_09530, partial [Acidobacteria bacterium]
VGDIAFANVGAVAVGLAEEDGLVDFAVGGGPGGAGDVHVHMIRHKHSFNNENIAIIHVYIIEYKTAVK